MCLSDLTVCHEYPSGVPFPGVYFFFQLDLCAALQWFWIRYHRNERITIGAGTEVDSETMVRGYISQPVYNAIRPRCVSPPI